MTLSQDTGMGIPKEAMDRIFSPLYTKKPSEMWLVDSQKAVEVLWGAIKFTLLKGSVPPSEANQFP